MSTRAELIAEQGRIMARLHAMPPIHRADHPGLQLARRTALETRLEAIAEALSTQGVDNPVDEHEMLGITAK